MDLLEFMMDLDICVILPYSAFSHNYAKIKVDSFDFLPLEERLNLHNVIIFIKSVFNKSQNPYYYNNFLEECLYHSDRK